MNAKSKTGAACPLQSPSQCKPEQVAEHIVISMFPETCKIASSYHACAHTRLVQTHGRHAIMLYKSLMPLTADKRQSLYLPRTQQQLNQLVGSIAYAANFALNACCSENEHNQIVAGAVAAHLEVQR